LKRHQDRIRSGLADIDRRLAEHDTGHADAREYLDTALGLLTNPADLYAASGDVGKRLANQAFYERIVITEDETAAVPDLAQPFRDITALASTEETDTPRVGIPPTPTPDVGGSNKNHEG